MKALVLIIMLLAAGCEKYRENPDFPFPEFNKGRSPAEVSPCPENNIRKTLTPCEP